MAKVKNTFKAKMQGAETEISILGGSIRSAGNVSSVTIRIGRHGTVLAKGINLVAMQKGFRLHALSESNVHTNLQAHLRAVEIEPFETALTQALAAIKADAFDSK